MEEREMLRAVFNLNRSQKDVLMGLEVQRAVLEAGLIGNDAPERRAVAWASRPPAAWQEGNIQIHCLLFISNPTLYEIILQLTKYRSFFFKKTEYQYIYINIYM